MTARKSTNAKSEADKDKKDDVEATGTDQSKTSQTTSQKADKEDAVPESAEKRDETVAPDANDQGSYVGTVVDGDSNVEDRDEDDSVFDDFADADSIEGGTGTVVEKNLDGDEYEVPYALLTTADLARTSDSDDPAKSWTAQHASGEREDEDGNSLDPEALVPVEGTPGQTFRVGELPNRDVAEKAGIDYDQWVAGLPVRADVPNEAPRKGIPA